MSNNRSDVEDAFKDIMQYAAMQMLGEDEHESEEGERAQIIAHKTNDGVSVAIKGDVEDIILMINACIEGTLNAIFDRDGRLGALVVAAGITAHVRHWLEKIKERGEEE